MKMLMVVYNSGVQEDLNHLLAELDPPGHTVVNETHGVGGTGQKFGDQIWPGSNNILYVVLPDEEIPRYAAALNRLKRSYRLNPGISVYALPVEDWSDYLDGAPGPKPDENPAVGN